MGKIFKLPDKQVNSRNSSGRFKSGVSGNPHGRPKGLTIKERIRKYLENNPKQVEKMVDYFIHKNPELTWQMLEGRPPKATVDKENPIVHQITGMQIIYDKDGK